MRPVGTGTGDAQSKQKGVRQVRRALVWFLILGLIVSLVLVAGCGKDEANEKKTAGESEITQENGEAEAEVNAEGEAGPNEAEGENASEDGGGEAPADDGSGEVPADGSGGIAPPDIPEGTEVIPDISRDMPTEEQLGAPFYPGAAYVTDSGGTATSTGPDGEISVSYAEFTTADSFDKVVAFYEGSLGPPQLKEASVPRAMWVVDNGDGSMTMVTVEPDSGGLKITLGRTTGDLEQY